MANLGEAQWSMSFSGFADDTPEMKAKFEEFFNSVVTESRSWPGHGGYEGGNGNGAFFSHYEPETYYHEDRVPRGMLSKLKSKLGG